MLAVYRPLFDLGGKPVFGHKGYFGTKQSNAFGTPIQRTGNVATQPDIHPQLHPPAVLGDAGQIFECL